MLYRLGDVSNYPVPEKVSDIFEPSLWREVKASTSKTLPITVMSNATSTATGVRDLGTVRIAFDRPEVRNAFRPGTVDELYRALDHARMTSDVGTVLLTGNGPSAKDGGHSFCSGGDQRIRGRDGYRYADGETAESVDPACGPFAYSGSPASDAYQPEGRHRGRQWLRPGGGHSLHVVADLTLASKQHGKFKQTDATVGSFDAGYGSALLARHVGQKRAGKFSSPPVNTRLTTCWP